MLALLKLPVTVFAGVGLWLFMTLLLALGVRLPTPITVALYLLGFLAMLVWFLLNFVTIYRSESYSTRLSARAGYVSHGRPAHERLSRRILAAVANPTLGYGRAGKNRQKILAIGILVAVVCLIALIINQGFILFFVPLLAILMLTSRR